MDFIFKINPDIQKVTWGAYLCEPDTDMTCFKTDRSFWVTNVSNMEL